MSSRSYRNLLRSRHKRSYAAQAQHHPCRRRSARVAVPDPRRLGQRPARRTTMAARSCWPTSTPASSSARCACSPSSACAPPSCARANPTLVAEAGLRRLPQIRALRSPRSCSRVAEQLAVRLRDTSQRLADLAFLDVAGRLAHILLELTRRRDAVVHPRGLTVRVSRQELARIVGCSREMAGRVLKRLEEDGLVVSEGRNITVIGPKKPAAPVSKDPLPKSRAGLLIRKSR